jgi:signal transduction histidine kinase
MFKDAISLKNIEFVVKSEFQSLVMPFDPGAIEKVLSNLLSNAYKFTNENGRIELFIGPAANPTVGYLRDSSPEFIEIAVKDTGKGISKEILGHIFDRYYKSEAPGLANINGIGIGLDFTKSLVELHHGYIVAESTENIGSTFRIFLPAKEISYSQNEFATNTLRTEDYTMDFNSAILSKIFETKINAVDPDPSLQKKHSVLIIDDDI